MCDSQLERQHPAFIACIPEAVRESHPKLKLPTIHRRIVQSSCETLESPDDADNNNKGSSSALGMNGFDIQEILDSAISATTNAKLRDTVKRQDKVNFELRGMIGSGHTRKLQHKELLSQSDTWKSNRSFPTLQSGKSGGGGSLSPDEQAARNRDAECIAPYSDIIYGEGDQPGPMPVEQVLSTPPDHNIGPGHPRRTPELMESRKKRANHTPLPPIQSSLPPTMQVRSICIKFQQESHSFMVIK